MSDPARSHSELFYIPENIMPGAEPMFKNQGREGFLFLHGFTGSPYEGRDFFRHFSDKGYAVWVPLLPGHGTSPEELEDVVFTDWLQSAEQYYLSMKAFYKKVIICGQSMGGALALHLAANYPVDVLVSLAGVTIIKDWRLKLLPIAKKLIRYQYKSKGPDIRCKSAKEKSASYHKYPIKSLIQFLSLIEYVRNELTAVECPALLIHSRQDRTITYDNLEFISNRISSPHKRTITLEESYHIISVDQEKSVVFKAIEDFIKAV